jgi:CBS domain-containing protein
MKEKDVGAVPILEGAQIVGMVTDRDITVRALADGRDISKLSARDVMSGNVACCHDTDAPRTAERLMETRQIRRLPVLDSGNKVVGMVSLGDISHAMSDEQAGRLAKAVSAHHV